MSTFPFERPDAVRGVDPAVPAREAVYLDRGPALPAGYAGKDRLVLMVRDSGMLHAHWMLEGEAGRRRPLVGGERVLRLYDLSAGGCRDLAVAEAARSAYVEAVPGRRYRAEIGVRDAGGAFLLLADSGEAETPAAGPSASVDPNWSIAPEDFAVLLALSASAHIQPYEKRAQA